MKLLFIDSCVRGESSATKKLCDTYLNTLEQTTEIEHLVLSELSIAPLNLNSLKKRDSLAKNREFQDEIFDLARQFKEADEIIIAAPYWDLSFPALLKVYLEQICVSGLTFGYEGSECVGYCQAKRLLYFSTCGGFAGERHLGAEYVKALSEMLGIPKFHAFTIEGMDIDPAKREVVLEAGIRRILQECQNSGG